MTAPRSGYTLPVFACASALAALQCWRDRRCPDSVELDLVTPNQRATVAIEQGACLDESSALAITRSDPGDNLDLTRHTPVWAKVSIGPGEEPLRLLGGEGIGKHQEKPEQAAIYRYAQMLFQTNLAPWYQVGQTLTVEIILPEGRALAERTSNAAFGIVEGLSLLGTSGIAQALSAPEQLTAFQADLARKARESSLLVFCLGENGLALAQEWGIASRYLVKTANWLGPLLVTAALEGVSQLLLLGYHGKLIKVAGGIFHTHHHLADARLEILTAQAAKLGLATSYLQTLLASSTTEAALQQLRTWEQSDGQTWATPLYQAIAETIDQRAQAYIFNHTEKSLQVGSLLFDRSRRPLALSSTGQALLTQLDVALELPS
ncbi:cobalt-precorrin-5B (C(1))-methyltransferase CbiD [Synechocystis sp. LKSZ1]|uniref:cobalt-precorrin-5B (C(1))-methyltransferase CbiD n=1 Tax=Synechocystis sp. LKSZ1 TaxID=3144951 RepID=UPI00336BC643